MNNPSVIPAFDFREMVTTLDNKIITTSLKVADYFGKRHKDVLRAIRNLNCSDDFTQRNFAPIDFIDKHGDVQPMYNITRDGCMMLVMGFTGKTAAAVKECYINAFNWMADQLTRWNEIGEQAQHRHALKVAKSEVKARIGSKMMNARKREKKLLAMEFEQILSLTQPKLIFTE